MVEEMIVEDGSIDAIVESAHKKNEINTELKRRQNISEVIQTELHLNTQKTLHLFKKLKLLES